MTTPQITMPSSDVSSHHSDVCSVSSVVEALDEQTSAIIDVEREKVEKEMVYARDLIGLLTNDRNGQPCHQAGTQTPR